jgi:hypothetical protein
VDPNIPGSDWKRTPHAVKAYVFALRAAVQRLQKRLQESAGNDADPASDLCFNGLTDYLATPSPLPVSAESFSFESRIFVNGNRAGEFKIVHVYGPSQEAYGTNWVRGPARNAAWLSYQWGGVWWGMVDSEGTFHAIHSGPARSGDVNPPLPFMDGIDSVPVNCWHHVAGTWDGQTMRLYVDGEMVKDAPFSGDIALSTHAFIGAHYGGTSQFLPGRLDAVRIWNRALRQDEVRSHNTGNDVDGRDNLVIEYTAERSPVQDQVSEHRRTLQQIRSKIPREDFDQLSAGETDLIQDLVDHLQSLENQAEL